MRMQVCAWTSELSHICMQMPAPHGGGRGCRNERKKKLGVSNTPYDGGRWVTDGGWWVTDGGWCVTDGGWWVATKHQRVDAIVIKKKGERPYGTPWVEAVVRQCRLRVIWAVVHSPETRGRGRATRPAPGQDLLGRT